MNGRQKTAGTFLSLYCGVPLSRRSFNLLMLTSLVIRGVFPVRRVTSRQLKSSPNPRSWGADFSRRGVREPPPPFPRGTRRPAPATLSWERLPVEKSTCQDEALVTGEEIVHATCEYIAIVGTNHNGGSLRTLVVPARTLLDAQHIDDFGDISPAAIFDYPSTMSVHTLT